MDNEFLMEYLRRLRQRRKICLRQSILCLDLCAAAPGRSFACAGDLPQILHGFHPGKFMIPRGEVAGQLIVLSICIYGILTHCPGAPR